LCCKTQYKLPENTTEVIIYKPEVNSKGFVFNVPKNYIKMFITGKSYGYGFVYKNDMLLYISEEASFHYDREMQVGTERFEDVYNKIILAEYNTIPNCDTLILEGIKKSLYWKENFIYWKEYPYLKEETFTDSIGRVLKKQYMNPNEFTKLYFGYINVPKKYKELFDNSLNSLRPLEDTTIKQDPIILELFENQKNIK